MANGGIAHFAPWLGAELDEFYMESPIQNVLRSHIINKVCGGVCEMCQNIIIPEFLDGLLLETVPQSATQCEQHLGQVIYSVFLKKVIEVNVFFAYFSLVSLSSMQRHPEKVW